MTSRSRGPNPGKILVIPNPSVLSGLTDEQQRRIREAAGGECELVIARGAGEAMQHVADAEVVFGELSAEAFAQAGRLRWLQAISTGANRMLYPSVVDSDIPLVSNKGRVGNQMAEHAFALLLGLTRGIAHCAREGSWLKDPHAFRRTLRELTGMTMGVLGLGGTGIAVARRAEAFGMRVVAVNPSPVARPAFVAEVWSPERFYDLLAISDVIAICCPLTPATRGLFDREAFRRMKTSAILINVTRGEIVDGRSLEEALLERRIAGAGLDVTSPEPLPADSPLSQMDNVIITSHTAGASPHAGERSVELFCENLRRWRRGEPLQGLVDKRKGY